METGRSGARGIDREDSRQWAAELLASGVGEGEAGRWHASDVSTAN